MSEVDKIVKPLEWVKHPMANGWRSETMLGMYQVWYINCVSWQFDGWNGDRHLEKGDADESAAKAAAQADYEQRILSAIDTFAIEELEAENKRLVDMLHAMSDEMDGDKDREQTFLDLVMDRNTWRDQAVETADDAAKTITSLEERIKRLEETLGGLLDAYSKPDELLCCGGRDCGCKGSTVHQLAEHYARAALKGDA